MLIDWNTPINFTSIIHHQYHDQALSLQPTQCYSDFSSVTDYPHHLHLSFLFYLSMKLHKKIEVGKSPNFAYAHVQEK